MNLQICMGSACVEKGAYRFLETVRRILSENGVGERVTLTAAFCMGRCGGGIGVKVDGEYRSVRSEDAEAFALELVERLSNGAA